MTKREMTVGYCPGKEKSIPMIRISNRILATVGLEVGTKIEVTYGQNIITIKKITRTL